METAMLGEEEMTFGDFPDRKRSKRWDREREHVTAWFLTVKVGVDAVLQVGARAKVDELELQGPEVDQEVLVLDVAVDDPLPVAGDHGLDHLPEEVPRHLLLEHALLRDEVKEVLAGRRLLHDVDEGVVALVEVQQTDHAGDGLDLGQQLQFEGDSPSLELK